MSLTYGFYNSVNHDRRYDTTQISRMFDGIIKDGIFASIGDCFVVKAGEGMIVNVGSGKAWFNHTWTNNDTDLPIEAFISEVVLGRIDSLVLEVDETETVRANTIKFVKGVPSSNPVAPTLTNTTTVHQHLLCTISIPAGSKTITQAQITSYIGTDSTPFVTGILSVVSLDTLLGQWQTQLDEFIASEETDFDAWYATTIVKLNATAGEIETWTANEEAQFLAWFQNIKDQLGDDAAGNLQNQITKEEISRTLMTGLLDGVKTFSDDGTVISTTATDGRTLVKTFTNGFLECTTILRSSTNGVLGTMVKTFSADGSTINTVVTI